jgi:hypothetical protein
MLALTTKELEKYKTMEIVDILTDVEKRIAQLEQAKQTDFVVKKLKEYEKLRNSVDEGYFQTYISNRATQKMISMYS